MTRPLRLLAAAAVVCLFGWATPRANAQVYFGVGYYPPPPVYFPPVYYPRMYYPPVYYPGPAWGYSPYWGYSYQGVYSYNWSYAYRPWYTVLETTREVVEAEQAMQSGSALPREENAMRSNSELERAVLQALRIEPTVDFGHVGVTAVDGVVWLRGAVPDTTKQWLAERVAAAVEGVTRVVNHLEVIPPGEATPVTPPS